MAITAKTAPDGLTEAQAAWLKGDWAAFRATLAPWEYPPEAHEPVHIIDAHGERFLKKWVAEHPGTRPFWWWQHVELPEDGKRLRVGGVGDERNTDFEDFDFGVRGRRDQWNLVGRIRYDGALSGEPIDRSAPPLFESQASFLKRHRLFLRGERQRLGECSKDK
jgi:hypothetical protein